MKVLKLERLEGKMILNRQRIYPPRVTSGLDTYPEDVVSILRKNDIETIEECLKRLSQLVTDFEEIQELDINPLIVYEKGKGCCIVDARIILSSSE